MIFTNSKGYEYHIRLVGQEGDDPLTLDNIRIDHTDRPDMTLEEYFAFALAEAERPYFEFMDLEILDSLQEGNGLEITKDDLNSLPKELVDIRIYRTDRDALAARDRHQEKEYKNMDRYEIEGYEVIEMVVRSGNQYSARANLPLAWQGLRIKVVRLDPLPEVVENCKVD